MNILKGSPRVEITISVNPEFELRLASLWVQKCIPTAADFDGNRSISGMLGAHRAGMPLLPPVI